MTATTLHSVECLALTFLGGALWIGFLLRFLGRGREGWHLGKAMAAGYIVRCAAIAVVSLTGYAFTLRGGDELIFLEHAMEAVALPIDSPGWVPTDPYRLHELVFAAQIKLFAATDSSLRITQIVIAMTGLMLLAAAIHDLAGPRAARITAWLLALEPTNVFFNSLLHKEANITLAVGLIALGGARTWTRLHPAGLALMALGAAVAVTTRNYAGWFLVAGCFMVVLHASLRQLGTRLRAVGAIYAVGLVAALAAPLVLQQSSPALAGLQASQDANTILNPQRDPNGNRLKLAAVDFSSPGAVLANLPTRIRDILVRPYPWQLQSPSQRAGLPGTLVALLIFGGLVVSTMRRPGSLMASGGPFVYPLLFLTVAYALSVGNAGTGFRYRTNLVVLAIGALVVVRARHKVVTDVESSSQRARDPRVPRFMSPVRPGLSSES
jgi:hypothetical protein